MATAAEKKPCAKCQKGAGVTSCDGCQQSFCIKHIIEHRQELAIQLDNIGQEHDTLRRDLIQEDSTHPLLSYIDQWEHESIMKIQIAAKKARTNVQHLLNQMKNDVKSSVDKIADELQKCREFDDYTEIDLTRWFAKLKDIRELLETPSTIQIVEDQNSSSTIRFIEVLEKTQTHLSTKSRQAFKENSSHSLQLHDNTREIFDKTMDLISLSEGGLVATFSGTLDYYYPTIFGKNLYVSRTHDIRFRVENKTDIDDFFFGIVTSSQDIEPTIFNAPSAHGWWGFNLPVINGKSQKSNDQKFLQKGDRVKLTLDCDNTLIRLENYATKYTVQLRINTKNCPFPWKIAISLSRPNDTLRILV